MAGVSLHIIGALLLCAYGAEVSALVPIGFASHFGPFMVLHRAPRSAHIWGTAHSAHIGEEASVTLIFQNEIVHEQKVEIARGNDPRWGKWSAVLPPREAGGPYKVRVTLVKTGELAEIYDVAFGDVWLCAGQSNMEMPVRDTFNATDEMERSASYFLIRLFHVGHVTSATPKDEVLVSMPWTRPFPGRVGRFGSVCWSFARQLHEHTKIPIGIIQSTWGGTRIEPWMSPDALKSCGQVPPDQRGEANIPSRLWNSMISPLLQTTITGAIWYQGESNADRFPREDSYACRFPAMIQDWRQKFNAATQGQTDINFPFGFVQISTENPDFNIIGGFPALRWLQSVRHGFAPNPRMTNTFMAVTNDLADLEGLSGNNHPRDKHTVATRLLYGLRNVWMGEKDVRFQGPMPTAYRLANDKLTLTLWLSEGPIKTFSTRGYELCCVANADERCKENEDHRWVPAMILSGTPDGEVTLSNLECAAGGHVVGHRYNWRATPCHYKNCAVYSIVNDLPAPPYIKFGKMVNDGQWHDIKFNGSK